MAKLLLPARSLAWPIAWAAVELIARAESLRLRAYLCPAGVPTIGWGETEGVSLGMTWTKQQADTRLCSELERYAGEGREARCLGEHPWAKPWPARTWGRGRGRGPCHASGAPSLYAVARDPALLT